ncbi:hypothetical protein ACFPM0_24375 [Pseudonocardia sulfidoxydans]|uniref:hypothetical protein n=1 Tax=Pseudonocardia sulfidoxydans TaxID=54011 RepID=UPI0036092D3C
MPGWSRFALSGATLAHRRGLAPPSVITVPERMKMRCDDRRAVRVGDPLAVALHHTFTPRTTEESVGPR